MGADYSAYAVIGCEVTGRLYSSKVIPGCKHPAAAGVKFCSTCGAKSRLEHTPIKGYNPDEETLAGLRVYTTGEKERAFIGIGTDSTDTCGSEAQFLNLDELAEARTRIKSKLAPLGLWDQETYGLWSIMHCSC